MSQPQQTATREKRLRELAYNSMATALFGFLGEKLVKAFNLSVKIVLADMKIHPITYASRVLFNTFLAAVIGTIIAVSLYLFAVPSIIIIIVALGTIVSSMLVFFTGIYRPDTIARSHAEELERELPFTVAYMATMFRGGMGLPAVFSQITHLGEVLPASVREVSRIVRDVKIFNIDWMQAITRHAIHSYSVKWRDFVLGLKSAYETGSNIAEYSATRARELFKQYAEELRRRAGTIQNFMNMYVVLNVILPVTSAILMIAGSIKIPGFAMASIKAMVPMTAMIAMIMSPIFALLLHFLVPGTGFSITKPYKYAFVGMGIGVAIAAVIILTNGIHVWSVLLSITIVVIFMSMLGASAWLTVSEYVRRAEHGLANFIRDIAEARKAGLSIEQAIEEAGYKSINYGMLGEYVKRLAVSIKAGMDVNKALKTMYKRLKDRMSKTIITFLIDAIEYGGSKPEIIEMIASFVEEITVIETDSRKRIRNVKTLAYLGIFLTLGMAVILLWLIRSAPGIVSEQDVQTLTYLFSLMTVISSFTGGLMSGKLSTTYYAAGFREAMTMSVISVIVLFAVSIIMGIPLF